MYGKSLRYCGYGHGFDDIITHGSTKELKFVAYYLKEDQLVAVASLNRDPVVSQLADVMRIGKVVRREDIDANEADDWSTWLI